MLGWWLTFAQDGLPPSRNSTLCSAHSSFDLLACIFPLKQNASLGVHKSTALAGVGFGSCVGCVGLAPPGASSCALSRLNHRHLHLSADIVPQKRAVRKAFSPSPRILRFRQHRRDLHHRRPGGENIRPPGQLGGFLAHRHLGAAGGIAFGFGYAHHKLMAHRRWLKP